MGGSAPEVISYPYLKQKLGVHKGQVFFRLSMDAEVVGGDQADSDGGGGGA